MDIDDADDSPREKLPELDEQLNAIVQQFLNDLRAGASPEIQKLVDDHPDLAPDLERRLGFVITIFQAAKRDAAARANSGSGFQSTGEIPEEGSASDVVGEEAGSNGESAKYVPPDQAVHIRCPHCGNGVQLVMDQELEVTCRACGSTFHVDSNSATATFQRRPKLPSRIGRFEVLALIGKGGFGLVYKARDPSLDRLVALKIPRSGFLATAEEEQRFLREARAAAQLRHANIVQVHEVTHDNETPVIVSDFIDGLPLADILSGRLLGFTEAAALIAEVADALDFAHRFGVVHRDVKPSNILVDHVGRTFLTDFGLARRDEAEITITVDGAILGTLSYMSPEQAAGENHRVDGRSDVYSLGIVLYRMLTGELPFRGSRRMLTQQIVYEDPKPLRRFNEHIPRDLETICLKAIQKEPANRYASAREIADDLRRWQRHEPIKARRVRRWERAVRWTRRNPVVAALIGTVTLLLLMVAMGSLVWAWRERNLRTIADVATTQQAAEKKRAEEKSKESQHRLARVYLAVGSQQLERGDWLLSLGWFREAHVLEQHDPARDEVHRVRWSSILEQSPKLVQIFCHGVDLNSAILSDDGRTVMTTSYDGRVMLWDSLSGKTRVPAWQHGSPSYVSRFSPDGLHVVTAGTDQIARIWNTNTGEPVGEPMDHSGIVIDARFSPDGTRLVTACDNGSVRVWEFPTSKLLYELSHANRVHRIVFAPDGHRFLTLSGRGLRAPGEVYLWDLASGSALMPPLHHDDFVWDAEFQADGKRLATSSEDTTVVIWDTATGERSLGPLPHGASVNAVSFAADGQFVLSASSDGLLRRWNATTGTLATKPMFHHGRVLQVAVQSTGERFATACDDGSARVWDAESSTPITPRLPHSAPVIAVAFSENGRYLVTASVDGIAKLWDLATSPISIPPLKLPAKATIVTFSPSGHELVTADDNGVAAVWDIVHDRQLSQIAPQSSPIVSAAFHPSGQEFVTCGSDGTVRFWSTQTGKERGRPLRHAQRVRHAQYSPNGKHLVTASDDQNAHLWDVATGNAIAKLPHNGPVMAAAFSPDGQWIATASFDMTARLWRASDGSTASPPLSHPGKVRSVEFTPDSKRLATAGGFLPITTDGFAAVWSVEPRPLSIVMLPHPATVRAHLSSDGRYLVTASYDDGNARIWKTESGQPMVHPLPHAGASLNFAAFMRGDRFVFTTATSTTVDERGLSLGRGTATLWDASTGDPVTPPLWHTGGIRVAAISPNGQIAVTASDDQSVRFFNPTPSTLSLDDMRRIAEVYTGRHFDAVEGLIPIPADTLREKWVTARQRHPDLFQPSVEQLLALRDLRN